MIIEGGSAGKGLGNISSVYAIGRCRNFIPELNKTDFYSAIIPSTMLLTVIKIIILVQ